MERSGYTPSERAVHPAPGRDLFAGEEEALLQLLLVVDLPHSHRAGTGAEHTAQGRHHGPLDDGEHGDRAGSGLHRRSAAA